ncbi:MAG: hypothetical protein LBS46_00950 [Dysgonamonadaceae bacterium]|jgi:hypothetical protein|nr:hypothetical protein [Dysgonamonadaceae bacterium]
MKPIEFIFSHDEIFQAVKLESSLFAIRQANKEEESLFEQLVFDEEYLILFRQLFFEAQAEVTVIVSGYLKPIPKEPEYFETQDFSADRDYTLTLAMHDNWNFHLSRPVDIKIKEFIVAYILYRWLETKIPLTAAVYRDRSFSVLADVRILLEKRLVPVRRSHGYW